MGLFNKKAAEEETQEQVPAKEPEAKKITDMTAISADEMPKDPAPKRPAGPSWTCECGEVNTGKFCVNCGKPKPSAAPRKVADPTPVVEPKVDTDPVVEERTPEQKKSDAAAEKELKLFADKCRKIFEEIRKDMIGQEEVIEMTISAIIAGGNVLLEGAPGLGKTRLVRSLGKVFDLPFSRIQFTPDLMPADVTGTNIIKRDADGNSKFEFQKGPIFSNIVLADEINRATPKTQAALLEAMQEHKVTVMGETRKMDEPFFVLATQNPIEQDGTYPLPEAQMDRFMFKIIVPNPSADELAQIVNMTQKTMDETATAVCTGEELLRMRETAKTIPVSSEVLNYAMVMVSSTQPDSDVATETAKRYIRCGASPRAAQALITAAKVRALINGRYNVSYEDINSLAVPVLRHRVKLGFEAVTSRYNADDVVKHHIADLNEANPDAVETKLDSRKRR